MKINLQQFCSTEDIHTLFMAPFNIGEYTFATNRHVIARVPKIDEYDKHDVGITAESILEIIKQAEKATGLIPLVDWEKPDLKECGDCDGTGRVNVCTECKGVGELSSVYAEPCEKCETSGVIPGTEKDCPYCKGKGKKFPFFKPSLIGNGIYACAEYIVQIESLPNPRIGVSGTPEDVIPFSFDGGIGLLIPMRKD